MDKKQQSRLVRVDEFYGQNANKHARLKRKQKYAEEREHLDWFRNNIKQGIEKHHFGVILRIEMVILDSISDRLLDVLFTYEEMRLWLQTRPDIAAELNVDLSREARPDDLRRMLVAAVSAFMPPGTAKMLARQREKIRTAPAREENSKKSRDMFEKVPGLVKKFCSRHPLWKKQDVAKYVAIELKDPKTKKIPRADYIQRSPEFKKAWGEGATENPSASAKK